MNGSTSLHDDIPLHDFTAGTTAVNSRSLDLLLGRRPEWDVEAPQSAPRQSLEWYLERARRNEAVRAQVNGLQHKRNAKTTSEAKTLP